MTQSSQYMTQRHILRHTVRVLSKRITLVPKVKIVAVLPYCGKLEVSSWLESVSNVRTRILHLNRLPNDSTSLKWLSVPLSCVSPPTTPCFRTRRHDIWNGVVSRSRRFCLFVYLVILRSQHLPFTESFRRSDYSGPHKSHHTGISHITYDESTTHIVLECLVVTSWTHWFMVDKGFWIPLIFFYF